MAGAVTGQTGGTMHCYHHGLLSWRPVTTGSVTTGSVTTARFLMPRFITGQSPPPSSPTGGIAKYDGPAQIFRMNILSSLGLSIPIFQAPMAGISTPALAAAVSNAGALGALGLGAVNAIAARAAIEEVRGGTDRPFHVNFFAYENSAPDPARDAAWLDFLAPLFAEYGAAPPASLHAPYQSFNTAPDMPEMLLSTRPAVISFHFGLPSAPILSALRESGAILLATATNRAEAQAIERAGLDAIIAQGIEAGGHRGMFDPHAADPALSTLDLTRLLARTSSLPVIAAGGIMNGRDIADALNAGAIAAQMGTAFIACPESCAQEAHRRALIETGGGNTHLTSIISGRPARALANRFTALEQGAHTLSPPDYPYAYDAAKALHQAASQKGDYGFGAYWAGQRAHFARAMPADLLVRTLEAELKEARKAAIFRP